MKKFFGFILCLGFLVGLFLYWSLFVTGINSLKNNNGQKSIVIQVKPNMTFNELMTELKELGFRTPLAMKWYAKYTGFDRNLQPGDFSIDLIGKITVKDFFKILSEKVRIEISITVLPGWDLRDLAKYLVQKGIAKNEDEVYTLLGKPAEYAVPSIDPLKISWISGRPSRVSLEGYLAPDTYSIYTNATLEEVIEKLLRHREDQLLTLMPEIVKSGRNMHEIITMASLLEREVRSVKDKAIVADIFWKRHDVNMGLQADSTVHYATATEGQLFTTNQDRASKNFWNTYEYPALPPGPIAMPSLESIEAALRPTKNDYWYFLTTLDTGEVKYGSTLAEHNANVHKYLR